MSLESSPPSVALNERTNNLLKKGIPPTEYNTMVRSYIGKFEEVKDHLFLNITALGRIDILGDGAFRRYDEHVVKDPKLLRDRVARTKKKYLERPITAAEDTIKGRTQKAYQDFQIYSELLTPEPMRYKRTPAEIVENAKRLEPFSMQLELRPLHALHSLLPQDIEILHPEIYNHGVFLYDILRGQTKDKDGQPLIPTTPKSVVDIQRIDPFDAVAQTARFANQVHTERGAIGELLGSKVLFQHYDEGNVSKPLLDITDIVFNDKVKSTENAQKATDVLDFLFYVSLAEMQRSGENKQVDWESVNRMIETAVTNYGDKNILKVVESFAKRGRPTLVLTNNRILAKDEKEFLPEGENELSPEDEIEEYRKRDQRKNELPAESFTTEHRGQFAWHNKVRLGVEDVKSHFGIDDEQAGVYIAQVRQNIIDSCKNFVRPQPQAA